MRFNILVDAILLSQLDTIFIVADVGKINACLIAVSLLLIAELCVTTNIRILDWVKHTLFEGLLVACDPIQEALQSLCYVCLPVPRLETRLQGQHDWNKPGHYLRNEHNFVEGVELHRIVHCERNHGDNERAD